MASLPSHQVSESNNTRRIDIHAWTIETTTAPIINASESDALQAALGFPLPEMTFGNNELVLRHHPSGWEYRFDAEHALMGVRSGELQEGDGGVKVGYADAWLRSRLDPDSSMPLPTTSPTKPYDWTYTTMYPGHLCLAANSSFTAADPHNCRHVIPIAELTRQDPILFYAEVPLYEDELHDNGMSQVTIRVRVMPTSFFLLSRFTLRVDNVLFRTYDTRIYHSFAPSSTPLIVRETSGWEAPYGDVKRQLPSRNDLTPLIDPNFIAKTLSALPEVARQSGAGTGWRGLGSRLEVSTTIR